MRFDGSAAAGFLPQRGQRSFAGGCLGSCRGSRSGASGQ
jgi:hypothetical protein